MYFPVDHVTSKGVLSPSSGEGGRVERREMVALIAKAEMEVLLHFVSPLCSDA